MPVVRFFSRTALPALLAVALALGATGCGSAATRKAIQKAQTFSEGREYEKALRILNDAVAASPKDAKLREARLVVLLEVERLDLARQEMAILRQALPKKRFLDSAIRHSDPRVRKGAAQLLGSLGDPAVASRLVPLLIDPAVDVRRAAVAAFGNLRDSRSSKLLHVSLRDPSWYVRSDAAEAVVKLKDPEGVEYLVPLLSDEESYVRFVAARGLRELAEPRHQARFEKLLGQTNAFVRVAGAVALAHIGGAQAAPVLRGALEDKDWAVRRDAISGLAALRDQASAAEVRKRLADPEPRVRLEALVAVRQLRDMAAIPDLERMAMNDREDRNLRIAAAVTARDMLKAAKVQAPSPAAGTPAPGR